MTTIIYGVVIITIVRKASCYTLLYTRKGMRKMIKIIVRMYICFGKFCN